MSSSPPEVKRYRFGSQFQAIVNATQPKKKWYHIDWHAMLSLKNGYIFFSLGSFFFMTLFGILAIRVTDECKIQDPEQRCCTCVEMPDEAKQMQGQTMPMMKSYNSVYYGVLMIFNSIFGVTYIITGIRNENKYLLFAMVATQSLEVIRGLLDVILEPIGSEPIGMRHTREGLMYTACVMMIASWMFMRHMYRLFGWKIFRRGGAKKSIREMYKKFQAYRALNLLDIQSSAMLFLIFFLYFDIVRWYGYWVFFVLLACDIQASRYMVKYLKSEDTKGVMVCVACKVFTVAWWITVLNAYYTCYNRYEESRKRTSSFWHMERAPNLQSVYDTYNGVGCLAPDTTHDARTWEVVTLNFAQALIFRFGSLIVSFFVSRNFHRGLRDVFYIRAAPTESKEEELVSESMATMGNAPGGGMDEQQEDEYVEPYDGTTGQAQDPEVGEYSDEEREAEVAAERAERGERISPRGKAHHSPHNRPTPSWRSEM